METVSVCYDFDGCLNVYTDWRGHGHIGEPLKHPVDGLLVIDVVKELYDMGVELKLSTTRLNPYPFGEGLGVESDEVVVSGKAKEHVMDWLQKYEILHCFKEITGYKPYADLYVDDRGWFPTRQELMEKVKEKV